MSVLQRQSEPLNDIINIKFYSLGSCRRQQGMLELLLFIQSF